MLLLEYVTEMKSKTNNTTCLKNDILSLHFNTLIATDNLRLHIFLESADFNILCGRNDDSTSYLLLSASQRFALGYDLDNRKECKH